MLIYLIPMKNILLPIFSFYAFFFSVQTYAQHVLQARDNADHIKPVAHVDNNIIDKRPAPSAVTALTGSNSGHATPGGYFDIVFDRFGNQYSLNEIAVGDKVRHAASGRRAALTSSSTISTTLYTGCTPGYFRIYLETGCGMDLYATDSTEATNLNVLCQVLTDIANFIPSPCTATGQTVNIWVRGGLTTGLGVATPFFNITYSLTATGITDNTVWETLNSGVDAFKNIAPPVFTSGGGTTGSSSAATVYFHGSIALNFGGSISWHNNLHTAPTAGEDDLYTVALHEMMHIMGFCTLIDYNGRSVFDMYNVPPTPATYQYYSRYDQQLQTNSGVPLIIGSSPDCKLYQYGFNPAAGATPNAILSPGGLSAPGCATGYYTLGGETDNTVCSSAIKYLGGWGTALPVYTPACFEKGGSLSHFDDQCYVPSGFCPLCTTTNCEYFVLSNSAPNPSLGGYSATTNPGVMKRYLTPEERQVLCDIGYKVLSTFGNAANLNNYTYSGGICPGRQVVGFYDGITDTGTYAFSTVSGGSLLISGPSLGTTILDNDKAAGVSMSTIPGSHFKCLQVMTGTGTVSTDSGGIGTNVIYTAGATDFGVQLLRYTPVSNTGVEGNITYIYVFVGDLNCVPTACNLVTNGGFESLIIPGSYGFGIPGENCWTAVNYAPILVASNDTSIFPFFKMPNHAYFLNGIPHPLSPSSNDHYIVLYNAADSLNWYSSSIQEQLSTSLDSGQQYTLSFWALLGGESDSDYSHDVDTNGDYAISNTASHIQFAVGNTYPLIGTTYVPAHFMPAGFTSIGEFTVVCNDYAWQYFSFTFTYSGPSAASTLFIQGALWDDADSTILRANDTAKAIGIDDISITPAASACNFSIPGPISYVASPFDLATTASVCVAGGTFKWPTMPILTGGIPTTTSSSTFDPAAADSASIAIGGSSLIPVAYTYTTTAGCVQTVYTTIQILRIYLPPIAGIDTLCAGATTTLSDSTTGGTWSSSDTGVAIVGSSSGIVTGIAAGAATISYTVSDITVTLTIIVYPAPNAGSISGDSDVCAGSSITLTDGAIGGVWSSSNSSATVLSGIISGVSAGIDTISYTVTNSCGSIAAIAVVTVNPLPVTPSAIAGIETLCDGDTTTLSDLTAGDVWSSSVISIATINATGIVTAIGIGTTTISYATTNSCGTATATVILTINPLPIIPDSITGISTICEGDNTFLSDLTTGGTWSSGTASVASITSTGMVTGVNAGVALISYTTTNIGCSEDAIYFVTVNPLPAANFSYTGTSTVDFINTGTTTGADSIVWNFGDGNTSTANNPVYTYSVSGVYHVCETVYNSCGEDSACNNITVTVSGTGVSMVSVSNVRVYPNPTNDELYITGLVENTNYRLLNITGECMQQGALVYGSNTLSMKTCVPGVYVLEMTGDDGARNMVRVVKE